MSRRFALCLTIVVFLLPLTIVAQDDTATFMIVNNSDVTICAVNISPAASDSLGANLIDSQTIESNNSHELTITTGTYDVALQDCQNSFLYYQTNVIITDSSTLHFPGTIVRSEPILLTLANDSATMICAVAGRPAEAERWIFNWIIFSPGSSIELSIEPGTYDIGVLDCDDNALNNWRGVELTNSVTLTYVDFQDAINLNNLAMPLWQAGNYDEALVHFHKVLTITRLLSRRADEGVALNNIGSIHLEQGNYEDAVAFLNLALEIRSETQDLEGQGVTLNNIGLAYDRQGQYSLALQFYQRALEIRQQTNDQSGLAITLSNIGTIYYVYGQYDLALEQFNRALAIQQGLNDRAGQSMTISNIGLIYAAQGQYGQALAFFTQALEILHDLVVPASRAVIMSNIGSVYQDQGRYTEALDYYTQAIDIQQAIDDVESQAITLNNIGTIYHIQQQYDQALDNYTQALTIQQTLGNRDVESTTLHNIGLVYADQGQYAEALNFYTQALDIIREVGNRAGEGITLSNIGNVYRAQGQYAEAINFYTQALDITQEVGNRDGETVMLVNRASLYEELGQNIDAVEDYQVAVEISEQVVTGGLLDTAVSSLGQQPQNDIPYQRLSVLLTVEGDLALALDYAERGRAILTRTELTNEVIDFRAGADQSLLDRELDLRLELQSAQNLVDSLRQDTSATGDNIESAQQALDDARNTYDRHLETMQLQGGYLSREISFQTATLEQIQSVIPQDTTLLVYSIAEPDLADTNLPKSVVFLVTRDSLDAVILDVTDEEIDERVRAFAVDRGTGDVALGDLYTMVFAPIADRISTSHLIIAPDGSLNYVPFAALFTPTDGQRHYLIDDYTIRMTPSATALWLLSERHSPTPNNPGLVMSQDQAPGLPNLPNAFIEALQVGEILGVDAIRDGTETQLRHDVSGNGVLHISAHAELNRFAPLYSVIHLGEDDTHDGRLEVRAIYELDLSQGTELVVLSGCETGSGGDGEDFGLLNRAFFAVGAQEVVSSLWTVDDRATADLLVEFMRQRTLYNDDAEALRAAMLIIREEHPEPYLWASFVITGMRL